MQSLCVERMLCGTSKLQAHTEKYSKDRRDKVFELSKYKGPGCSGRKLSISAF